MSEAVPRSEQFRRSHYGHHRFAHLSSGSVHQRTEKSLYYCHQCRMIYCVSCGEKSTTDSIEAHAGCHGRNAVKHHEGYYRLVYGDQLVDRILSELSTTEVPLVRTNLVQTSLEDVF